MSSNTHVINPDHYHQKCSCMFSFKRSGYKSKCLDVYGNNFPLTHFGDVYFFFPPKKFTVEHLHVSKNTTFIYFK